MAKYLDPKADLTFKKVFGEHKDLVISFLNAMLPLEEGRQVEAIEYLAPELVPRTPESKYSIVDVRCEETGGRKFIVEMQMSWRASFKQRVLLNAAKAYVSQLPSGKEYHLLQPVYSLNIVNDTFEPDMEEYYHYYHMVHDLHTDKVLEGLHLVCVELPKFKAKNLTEKKMQILWLRFLTEIGADTRQAPQDLLDDPHVNKALGILEESAYSRAEMYAYDKFWDQASVEATYQRDWEGAIAERDAAVASRDAAVASRDAAVASRDAAVASRDAERDRADAERDRADEAVEKFRQTVRNLKAMNLSEEQIAAATGLSAAAIAEIC